MMPQNKSLVSLFTHIWIQRLLRIILGAIFIYAGYAKLDHVNVVAENLLLLEIFPWGVINLIAMWLLGFEIFIGIFLLTGIWLRASSALLIGFSSLCLGLIVFAIFSDLSMHCGCFVTSPTGDARDWGSLWAEGFILLGSVWLWVTTKQSTNYTN